MIFTGKYFKTLIELYDECPIDNVLSSEMFSPEETVFVCPPDVARNKPLQEKIREYFAQRGVKTKCSFVEASLMNVASVESTISGLLDKYSDCGLDISGGSDAALYAYGRISVGREIPTFTYSRKKNMFFNVFNAPFAEDLPCNIKLSVKDSFLMTGGEIRQGRADNDYLEANPELIDRFFPLFLRYRNEWTPIITYIQKISRRNEGDTSLHADGSFTVKGERNARITANTKALSDFMEAGLIRNLRIKTGESVAFDFRDENVRFWLRDIGSVLEIYTFNCCRKTGLFNDVKSSVIVDWNDLDGHGKVTNELDVMATCGVKPIFISCKTCDVNTEALNELAVLSRRFGSRLGKAAIVTSKIGQAPMRNRAMELGIDVINLDALKNEKQFIKQLSALIRE